MGRLIHRQVTAMKHLTLIPLLASLSLAQAAQADSTLEYRVGADADKLQSLLVKDGKVLAKGAADGGNMDLLYSSAPEQLSVIDHRKRTVMTLDETQVNRLAQQAETVQPLLQGFAAQFAKLNPKQRAKWEEMLGGKLPLEQMAAAAKPTLPANIVKTGRARKVAGIPCEQMNIVQGGTQMAELCLASPAKLNIPGEDYATLRALLNFSERLAAKTQGLSKQFGVDMPNLGPHGLEGVPIEMRETAKRSGSLRLNRIVTSAVSAEWMQIPDGYQTEPFKLWK